MAEKELRYIDATEANDITLKLNRHGADPVESVEDFVIQVLNELGRNDCIKKLTLVGHGSPGVISVGSGRSRVKRGLNVLSRWNIEQWEPHIRRLRCKFCEDGEFELVACNVGAELHGARLVRLLVNFLRCARVSAAADVVGPFDDSDIQQVLDAIGEDEMAPLPEPIPAEELKTSAVPKDLEPRTLAGGKSIGELAFYNPSQIVAVRYIALEGTSDALKEKVINLSDEAVFVVRSALMSARVASVPHALYAIESYLELGLSSKSKKKTVWLPRGALMGGCRLYSPLGADTTFVYELSRAAGDFLKTIETEIVLKTD